jgi:hypothetical protein
MTRTDTTHTLATRLSRLVPHPALWLLAAALFAVGLPAKAQTITYGTWKLTVKADAAAIAAGRNDFTEYVLIEEDGITAHEMCRLGFGTIVPTVTAGPNGSFNFTVTLTSRNQGTTKWTGNMTTTTMTGTLVWTKDGKIYNYTFTAVPFTPVEAES